MIARAIAPDYTTLEPGKQPLPGLGTMHCRKENHEEWYASTDGEAGTINTSYIVRMEAASREVAAWMDEVDEKIEHRTE